MNHMIYVYVCIASINPVFEQKLASQLSPLWCMSDVKDLHLPERFTSMHYILDTLYINVIIHNTTMCTPIHGFEFLINISVWYSFYDEKFSITSTWIFKSTEEPWPTILFSSTLYSRRHKGNDWAYYLTFTVWLCIKIYLSIGIRKIKVLSETISFMYCTIPAVLHVTYFTWNSCSLLTAGMITENCWM